MKHSVLMMTAALAIAMAAGCSKVNDIPEVNEEAHEFTITASCGADSKVASAFGDDQNTINFTWSENDSIFVYFIPKDSLATMTDEKASELKTYVFKLKSGEGTSNAVFSCTDLSSLDMKSDETYLMYADYHPCLDSGAPVIRGWEGLGTEVSVNVNQTHDPDNPIQNIAKEESMSSYGIEVEKSSTAVMSFMHRISVFRLKVKNTGIEPLTINSFQYPTSEETIEYPKYHRYFGESTGTIMCTKPVTIEPGCTYPFYIATIPLVYSRSYGGSCNATYIFHLSDNKQIKTEKYYSQEYFHINCGEIVSTTINIQLSMATSGTIPPISGDDEDDF